MLPLAIPPPQLQAAGKNRCPSGGRSSANESRGVTGGAPARSHCGPAGILHEIQLLEVAADDGIGVQTQPLLDQSSVNPAVVGVEVQVAFQQVFGLQ